MTCHCLSKIGRQSLPTSRKKLKSIMEGHYYIALEFMGFDEMSDRAQLEALLASALDEGYICDGIIAQSLTHLNEIWATR